MSSPTDMTQLLTVHLSHKAGGSFMALNIINFTDMARRETDRVL